MKNIFLAAAILAALGTLALGFTATNVFASNHGGHCFGQVHVDTSLTNPQGHENGNPHTNSIGGDSGNPHCQQPHP
ncbi:MAG: hypothetical protein DLM72_15280 [Candidatus Nitrosopolaris wilkensis]|nr:MAG: hypothetical protein DLM72_15280 [Candidatus Nitrosopolaris wilkensis]